MRWRRLLAYYFWRGVKILENKTGRLRALTSREERDPHPSPPSIGATMIMMLMLQQSGNFLPLSLNFDRARWKIDGAARATGRKLRVGQVGNETKDLARLPRRMLTIFRVMSELRKGTMNFHPLT